MGKNRSKNQELEQISRNKLKLRLREWIINDINPDFGLDLRIQLTQPDQMKDYWPVSHISFFAQLKASEEFEGDEYAKFDLETDLIKSYWRLESPVVLIMYEESSDTFYWKILQDIYSEKKEERDPKWLNQDKVRIYVDRENSLSQDLEERKSENEKMRDELKSFTEAILHSRKKINRDFALRMDHKGGLEEMTGPRKMMDIYHDSCLKGISALIESAKADKKEEANSAAKHKIRKSVRTLEEITFKQDLDDVSLDHIFDVDETLNELIALSKDLELEEQLKKLNRFKGITSHEVRLLAGITYRSIEQDEEFLIVDVEDWFPYPHKSMWTAIIQWDDGTFWDENAKAVIRNPDFQRVGFDYPPPFEKKCKEGEHEFSKEEIREMYDNSPTPKNCFCKECKLSADTLMQYFGEDVPHVCDECDQIDILQIDEKDRMLCEQCLSEQN